MMMSIVTRTGDTGETALLGGRRVSKDIPRVHAYGDIDELNALLGVILAEDLSREIRHSLEDIQHVLFRLGADISAPLSSKTKRIQDEHIKTLEGWIHSLESDLPTQTAFILPKGSRAGCLLHQSRAVCRRSERWVVTVMREEEINPHIQVFLNRLSDYLFLAARMMNISQGAEEKHVRYKS